MTTKINR